MASNVLFSSVKYSKYDPDVTLPAKFGRLIDKMGMEDKVKGKWTVIKMHLGRRIGYFTIHPMFVKILVDKLKGYGAKVYISDQEVTGAKDRGYTEDYLGVPIVPACGVTGKYYYEKPVDFKTFKGVKRYYRHRKCKPGCNKGRGPHFFRNTPGNGVGRYRASIGKNP